MRGHARAEQGAGETSLLSAGSGLTTRREETAAVASRLESFRRISPPLVPVPGGTGRRTESRVPPRPQCSSSPSPRMELPTFSKQTMPEGQTSQPLGVLGGGPCLHSPGSFLPLPPPALPTFCQPALFLYGGSPHCGLSRLPEPQAVPPDHPAQVCPEPCHTTLLSSPITLGYFRGTSVSEVGGRSIKGKPRGHTKHTCVALASGQAQNVTPALGLCAPNSMPPPAPPSRNPRSCPLGGLPVGGNQVT